MIEFNRASEEITKHLHQSRDSFQEAWAEFTGAEAEYNRAVKAREEMLKEVLKQKDMAVCSEPHYYSRYPESEDWKKRIPEDLGIFPRSQMHLRYDQGVTASTDHFTDYTSEFPVHDVLLLCPEHFPLNVIGIYGTKEVVKLSDEVVIKDGKFLLKKGGQDITRLIELGETHRSKILINGNVRPDLAVYRYFGIPDLPEKPDLNGVRYG